MDFHTHEDFEDEGLATFVESASDDFAAQQMCDDEEEITVCQPMILRFAAEDADQLVLNVAQMRYNARLFASEARAALTPQLCGLAPKASDELRARLFVALDECDRAFSLAVALEKAAVYALREGVAPVEIEADAEEAALEENPPAPEPKYMLSPACQSLRRQFFAVAHQKGLITKQTVRVQRVAAIANFLARPITSTGQMTEEEWTKVVYAIEDGRLQW